MAKRPKLSKVALTPEVIDDILDKIGDIVMPPQSTATFLASKLAQLELEAAHVHADPPDAIQQLRCNSDGLLLAAGVVAVGEDEKSLAWLAGHLRTRTFGPKSRETLRRTAKALRELYPEPKPKAKKKDQNKRKKDKKPKMKAEPTKKASKKKGGKKGEK